MESTLAAPGTTTQNSLISPTLPDTTLEHTSARSTLSGRSCSLIRSLSGPSIVNGPLLKGIDVRKASKKLAKFEMSTKTLKKIQGLIEASKETLQPLLNGRTPPRQIQCSPEPGHPVNLFIGPEQLVVESSSIMREGAMATLRIGYDLLQKRTVVCRSLRPSSDAAICRRRKVDQIFERQVIQQFKNTPGMAQYYFSPIDSDGFYHFIMPYYDGDLMDLAEDNETVLTGAELQDVTTQLVTTVATLHAHNVAHRDIKPENILVNADDNLKRFITYLADHGGALFDLSEGESASLESAKKQKLQDRCHSSNGTTIGYLSPDVIISLTSSRELTLEQWKKCDVWALGITLYSIIARSGLFFYHNFTTDPAVKQDTWRVARSHIGGLLQKNTKQYARHQKDLTALATKGLPVETVNIVKRMLDPDPDTRITMKEVAEILQIQIKTTDSSDRKEHKDQSDRKHRIE